MATADVPVTPTGTTYRLNDMVDKQDTRCRKLLKLGERYHSSRTAFTEETSATFESHEDGDKSLSQCEFETFASNPFATGLGCAGEGNERGNASMHDSFPECADDNDPFLVEDTLWDPDHNAEDDNDDDDKAPSKMNFNEDDGDDDGEDEEGKNGELFQVVLANPPKPPSIQSCFSPRQQELAACSRPRLVRSSSERIIRAWTLECSGPPSFKTSKSITMDEDDGFTNISSDSIPKSMPAPRPPTPKDEVLMFTAAPPKKQQQLGSTRNLLLKPIAITASNEESQSGDNDTVGTDSLAPTIASTATTGTTSPRLSPPSPMLKSRPGLGRSKSFACRRTPLSFLRNKQRSGSLDINDTVDEDRSYHERHSILHDHNATSQKMDFGAVAKRSTLLDWGAFSDGEDDETVSFDADTVDCEGVCDEADDAFWRTMDDSFLQKQIEIECQHFCGKVMQRGDVLLKPPPCKILHDEQEGAFSPPPKILSFADRDKSPDTACLVFPGDSNKALAAAVAREAIVTGRIVDGPKVVAFSTVQVRHYERSLSDNPSAISGPSVGIGWDFREDSPCMLRVFEYHCRGGRPPRPASHLLLDRKTRETILLRLGYKRSELATAVRMNIRVKNSRRRTINNLRTDHIEEAVEAATHSIKRLLSKAQQRLNASDSKIKF